ncbi:MAG TPA: LuxR C-terminal-related transcriptional regulator [Thermomicrobiales bacterium]|jgi:LuxR family maltose regulon positive regulatory protein
MGDPSAILVRPGGALAPSLHPRTLPNPLAPINATQASPNATPSRSVVSTKLYPPSVRAEFVARPHLLSLLDGDPGCRLISICAPAGFGKSTLVAQWLAELRMPRTWATFDADDDNPRSFFGLIAAALRTVDPDLVAGTESLLATKGLLHPTVIVHRLIADLSATTQAFVLVMDDVGAIESPEIQRAVDLLIQHAPPAMRIVLISRTELPLRMARFRANGELLEIREQDLQFTREEAVRFYNDFLDLDLTPSEIGVLYERTEGWVAGLQLIGVALRGEAREQIRRSVEGRDGDVGLADHYLWGEVLQRQPDDIQSFLLRTSILDRFTANLCDAVTGGQGSDDLIRRCERDNLFVIALDGIGAWHRYHQLFADVLRDRLVRTVTGEELDELHRRASQWFERAGLIEDAIRHAIAGHDWDRAIRMLEDHCAALFERDHVATLRDWLQGLPPTIFERSPQLAFWLAWALGRLGQWSEGAKPLRFAEEAWIRADDRPGQGALFLWDACRSLYGYDNLRAINYAHRALDLLPDDRSTKRIFALATLAIAYLYHGEPARADQAFADLRSLSLAADQPWFQLFEMAHSAGTLVQRGKLLDATVLCRRVIQAAADSPVEIWVQAALYYLGGIHREWGLLDDAEAHFRRGDELAELTGALQWRGRIRVGLARIAWARGNVEEAFDQLEHARGFETQLGNDQLARDVGAWQARFWMASHQIALARRWADSRVLESSLLPAYERQVEYLTYVRFLIREGRSELALKITEIIRQQAEAAGRDGDLVELSMLAAMAHAAGGDAAVASRLLHQALELGNPHGYVRLFVDEGQALAPLLRHEGARDGQRAYAQRLLTEIEGADSPEAPDPSDSSDALSEREIEVLRLVGAGLPNREIGQRLFISEKTVKKHMNNILRKLEAANRTHAVDRARQLGLI